MNPITINLSTLKAINLAASKEGTRYYLNGVCVEMHPRGLVYIATDGHILAAAFEEHETAPDSLREPFIIPRETLDLFKLKTRDLPEGLLSWAENDQFTLAHPSSGQSVNFRPVDGTFPDWRRFVPAVPEKEALARFNPALLARMAKISGALFPGGRVDCPQVYHNGENAAPVYISETALGVIMPMRSPNPAPGKFPVWADWSATAETEGNNHAK